MQGYKDSHGYEFDFGLDTYNEGRNAYNDGGGGIPKEWAIGCDVVIGWYHSGGCREDCALELQERIEDVMLDDCNAPPVLSNPSFDPAFGRTDTDFSFYIDYYDPDGDAPSPLLVYVNDAPRIMFLDSGDPDNGTYVWAGTIPEEGLATYYFTADDGRGGTDRYPDAGQLNGPFVYDDYTPPSSSCSAPGRSQTNSITVDYTSSDDNSGVDRVDLWMQSDGGGYSMIDSSTAQNGSFAVTLGSGNGVYDFYTRATDHVGNTEDAPGAPDASTIYDDTPPDSSADAGLEYYWTNLPVQVDFTADDNLSGVDSTVLRYRYEGGAWTDSGLTESGVAGTFDFYAPPGEGAYDFYTIATDLNGNVENPPTASQANMLYDATKPVSSCTSIDETNAAAVDVDFTASDNDDVDEVALWYLYEGGVWTDTGQSISADSGTFTFTFADGDGVYGFYTISQDMAGNVEDSPGSADTTVNLDQTMPQSSCTADPLIGDLPFDVDFTASDAGTGVASTKLYYRFEGETQWQDSYQSQPGESGTFSLDPTVITPQFGDGNYELMTIATDNVGNKEAPPSTPDQVVILDTTPPASSIDCVAQTPTSPLTLDYTANDSLSGVAKVALWYNFDGGTWADSGVFDTFGTSGYSIAMKSGTFAFAFPHGDGVYGFMSLATDAAGNDEAPGAADCTSVFDTTPPVSTGQTEGVVNDPTISVAYQSVDVLTAIANVHLYYRYTGLDGVPDDTLRDTGLDESAASGEFVWAPDMGPGYYNFYLAATDAAGNVEGTGGDADAVCLYDPRLALSDMDAPGYVTEPTVPIDFTTDIGNDGYDHVTLYYRYGATLPEAEAAGWITTSTVSTDPSGTLDFVCPDGDGYYQFFTRATSGSWFLEPIPDFPDATTLYDGIAPETSIAGPAISPTAQFDLTYTTVEAHGLVSIRVYYCYEGAYYLFATVYDMDGAVTFDAQGNEGVYDFYTIGTDAAGNIEGVPPAGYDCTVTVDLNPPQSLASVDTYGTVFPIEVIYMASDTVTPVVDVALWAKFEGGPWVDTGLSGSGELGTLYYTPASEIEGSYYFYTVALDEAGHAEAVPVAPDDQIMVDWTAPQTSCTSPEFSNAAVIGVTYTAIDALSGMSSVSAWIYAGGVWQDTGLVGPANGGVIEVDVSAWGEGTYGFYLRGRDNSGNVEDLPAEAPTTTVYDATEPVSAAGLPAEGVFANTTPVNVPYTADDTASGVASAALWFRFNGGAWEDSGLTNTPTGSADVAQQATMAKSAFSLMVDGSFSFDPPDGDGTYEFATRTLDNAGNLESLPDTPDGGALVFDQTAPSSSVAFEGTYAIGFPICLPFTAADTTSGVANVALYVSLDGAAYEDTGLTATGAEGDFDYTPETLAAGTYRFYSVATDNAGNVELAPDAAEATVIFDIIAPVSEASVPSEYTNVFPIAVSFAASDGGTGLSNVKLWTSFNSGDYAYTGLSSTAPSGTFNYVPGTLADGAYRFYTVGSDVAGNVELAPEEADASTVVDRTAPTSSCSIEGSVVNSFPLSLDYTSSDTGTGVEHIDMFYRFNSGAWAYAASLDEASGTFEFTPDSTADGYYEFYTQAYDFASNEEATAGADDSISVDTTAPRSSVFTPDASVKSVPFYVLFSARDDGSGVSTTALWYSYNGGAWVDSGLESTGTVGQFEFTAPEGQGAYWFYTVCQDNVGNVEKPPTVPDGATTYHIPKPEVHVSAESLSFGEVNVGEQSAESLVITNNGDADLTVTEVSTDDPAFEVSFAGGLPQTLRPATAILTRVTFAPDADGEFSGELSVVTDDPETPVVTVDLSGVGVEVPGEFVVDVWANRNSFHFGDALEIEMSIFNTDDPVSVDLSLVLVFDLGGPEERTWSASSEGDWTEGFSLYDTNWEIETGHDETTQLLYTTLPCQAPMVVKSGIYTLEMTVLEAGTSDLVTDVVIDTFTLAGEPFVDLSADKATYSTAGDTVSILIDARVPYDVTADYYVIMFTPDGAFWSPTGFLDAPWVADAIPIFAGISLDAGFEFSAVAFTADLPSGAPFDMPGNYTVFTALVELGTLTPISDLGIATFALE